MISIDGNISELLITLFVLCALYPIAKAIVGLAKGELADKANETRIRIAKSRKTHIEKDGRLEKIKSLNYYFDEAYSDDNDNDEDNFSKPVQNTNEDIKAFLEMQMKMQAERDKKFDELMKQFLKNKKS